MPSHIENKIFRELRCPKCRALQSKEYVLLGREQYKCKRCGHIWVQNYFVPKKILERILKMSEKEYMIFFRNKNIENLENEKYLNNWQIIK